MSLWLERQSKGATCGISLSDVEQRKVTDETVELFNGDNEEYRVRICSDNNAPYHPGTAISDDEETSYWKTNT